MQKSHSRNNSGFTIVELLVVIVVIGILAAITIVSYAGISQRAISASLQSDLASAKKQLQIYQAENDEYPDEVNDCPTPADGNLCLQSSSGNEFTDYSANNTTNPPTFTLNATNTNGTEYRVTNDSVPVAVDDSGTFVTAWGGAGNDYASSVVQTSDGGFAVGGYTASYGAGGNDMLLAKYTSNGTLSWSKTWGGVGDDSGRSLVQTSDGGYAVVGNTSSYTAGGYDMFIAKYTSDGTLSWSKTWGGTGTEYGYSVIQTSDGGYAVNGHTSSYGAGITDAFLVKYTSDGTLSWSKTWGGTSDDYSYGQSLVQTSDNGLVICGETSSYDVGNGDMFIAKYTSDGTLSWSKTWGSMNVEIGQSLIVTSDGGFGVIGYTNNYGAGGYDVFLAKYTSDGTLSWSKTWGGAGTDYGYSLAQASDDGLVISGLTTSYGAGSADIFLAKFTSDGSALSWSKTWGGIGDDRGFSLIQASDGSLVLSGKTNSYGVGNADIFLSRYASDGTITNCSSPMCQSSTATVTTPVPTVSSPTATVTTPSPTVTTPSPTVTSPTLTTTVVVAP